MSDTHIETPWPMPIHYVDRAVSLLRLVDAVHRLKRSGLELVHPAMEAGSDLEHWALNDLVTLRNQINDEAYESIQRKERE